ncbi:hypothetical protein XELAEV_18035685mg [Xenopus laevis]|uniref:Uncharacterized protein n=1 Tax=Xenopus laevis TaxID=8355 RepID=A0A974CGR3_XENLA|nr:hypothetical protein XELAEV_18035685mg [Xenopus laevis]
MNKSNDILPPCCFHKEKYLPGNCTHYARNFELTLSLGCLFWALLYQDPLAKNKNLRRRFFQGNEISKTIQ